LPFYSAIADGYNSAIWFSGEPSSDEQYWSASRRNTSARKFYAVDCAVQGKVAYRGKRFHWIKLALRERSQW
jgi:hypothetical protein